MKQFKQNLPLYILSVSVMTALVSCDKEDRNEPSSQEKYLTAKEWKIQNITRKSIRNPNQDSSILKSCSSDDLLAISTTKQFLLKDGSNKCDSTILAYDSGNWDYQAAQNVLLLKGSKKVQKWQIQTLNDSILKVQWLDSVSATSKVLKTIHLKNK